MESELAGWKADMARIVSAVAGLPGVETFVRFPQANGRRSPHAVVSIEETAGMNANAVINALQCGEPRIFVFEHSADAGKIVFMPEGLRPGEAEIVGRRLHEILTRGV